MTKQEHFDLGSPDTIKVDYWHRLKDGRIQCDLCPRECKMHAGQRGLCFVRANQGETMVLTTYGRSSGFCIDPVEKKPLNHFYPGSPVLSFGTAGCNLACKFCQNWDISKSRQMDTLLDIASPETIARAAKETGCKSVAYTYNDPVIFHEYAIDVAQACAEHDIKSIAVSAGYVCPEPREEFYRHIHAANIDLKAFSEAFYWKLTGAHLDAVLETLKYIKHETDTWLEITTLLIPGENDSEKEFNEMTQWIVDNLGRDVPLHFSAFHPDYKMQNTPATSLLTLKHARELAMKNGLKYVYTGNVHYSPGDTTYCHNCGEVLIERDWYELKQWNLSEKHMCKHCGAGCAGYFDVQPGSWGSRRQPVYLKNHA